MPRIQITVNPVMFEILSKRAEKKHLTVNQVVEIILYDALRVKEYILNDHKSEINQIITAESDRD